MEKIKQKLKELGLDDTQINSFISETITDKFIPKFRMDEINEKNKQLLEDVASRDKQIKELSLFKGDNEQLRVKIDELEKANKSKDEENAKAIHSLKIDNAVNYALNGKVQEGYDDLVRGLIDKSLVTLKEDGSVIGLDEQIAKIKESKALLFIDDSKQGYNSQSQKGWEFKGSNPPDSQKQTFKTVSENFVASLLDGNKETQEATKAATEAYFGKI